MIETILQIFSDMGYGGILFLMTIESSFIPFPSEIIIPPAAYLASQGEMNVYLVVFFGILGSLLGAIINYYLAMWLGRATVYSLTERKLAKFVLINSAKVKKAEDFFLRHGSISTFFGRLIPVIRQLISLPAGFSKMDLKKFIFFTSLGSGIWVVILALLGYFFGVNQELILEYSKQFRDISLTIVALAVIAVIVVVVIKKKRK